MTRRKGTRANRRRPQKHKREGREQDPWRREITQPPHDRGPERRCEKREGTWPRAKPGTNGPRMRGDLGPSEGSREGGGEGQARPRKWTRRANPARDCSKGAAPRTHKTPQNSKRSDRRNARQGHATAKRIVKRKSEEEKRETQHMEMKRGRH